MAATITILGATGSIGRSTLDVIARHGDRFSVSAVVGGRGAEALAKAARESGARFAALADERGGDALRAALAGSGIACGAGASAVREAAERDADIVVAAISGTAGLAPTHAALKPGRRIALANKESLVTAGAAFMRAAARAKVTLLPVDSEHNALAQALAAGLPQDVEEMAITASGGPFRAWPREKIAAASAREAAAHPTWSMGMKINIDSATLMNKGLELIEAHHLFSLPADRLTAVVHPQSIVHGLVHWRDGCVTAALYEPDMRVPIAHCLGLGLGRGERLEVPTKRLDLARTASLTFEAVDEERFPCIALARQALREGGAQPTVLNAANEIAVAAYIDGAIGFYDIPRLVAQVCERARRDGAGEPASVADALALDEEARNWAREALAAANSAG